MKRKVLVFHIGCDAGFFSEYLGMIFAIAYCKMNNIEFRMYSHDANFSYERGWTDYFEPFCKEEETDFHSIMNKRIPFPTFKQYIKAIYKKTRYNTPIPKWFWQRFTYSTFKLTIERPFYKRKYGFDYFTFELWNKFNYKLNPCFDYNRLMDTVQFENFCGSLRNLYQIIIEDTWRYRFDIYENIYSIIRNLDLPEHYIGMHIRAGDKASESEIYSYDKYFNKLNIIDNCQTIFLLTDDYFVVEEIKLHFPYFKLYTLCNNNEHGYDNSDFQSQSSVYKKQKLIELFASIEMLIHADIYVGVYNSSPDMFIDLIRENDTYFVDK